MVRNTSTAMLLAGMLVLGACGDGDGGAAEDTAEPTAEPTATATTEAATTPEPETEPDDGDETEPAAGSVTIDTATTDLGEVLVDGEGMTLYLFDQDPEGESACVDDCASTWPPLVGEPEATGGAEADLVGTITRPDGSTQATYDGYPLYLYAPDSEPGDVTGQGVGGVWWVVGPDGTRITDEAGGDAGPNY